MEKLEHLEDILRHAWNLLFRAAVQSNNPMHTPALATFDGLFSSVRTVVLRETNVEQHLLTCYTDFRSKKVREIQEYPHCSWLFWHPGKHVQIRASGYTRTHHQNDFAKEKWQQLPPRNRRDYGSLQTPGTVTETSGPMLPDFWEKTGLEASETEYTFDNFAVLQTEVVRLDWLHLHREGHQRAQFQQEHGKWKSRWLIP